MEKIKKITDEIRKNIINLYQQGYGGPEIGKILQVGGKGASSIYKVLHEAGIRPNKIKEEGGLYLGDRYKFQEFTEVQKNEIISKYKNGVGLSLLSETYGKNSYVIVSLLKNSGIPIRRRGNTGRKFNEEDIVKIISFWNSGESLNAIAKKFNATSSTVRIALLSNGQEVGIRSKFNSLSQLELSDMLKMWNNGYKQETIAHKYHTSTAVISLILKKLRSQNLEVRMVRREKHGNWRNGKVVDKNYIYIKLPLDNPYYSMCNNGGYVFEHRFKIAEFLGRALTKEESVHHKDGNPSNNDISNLELRKSGHGKGASFRCRSCGSIDIEAV